MMKDNIITIDWTDEVLAKTALTHDGKLCDAAHAGSGNSDSHKPGPATKTDKSAATAA
jgi:NAD(P) transhydrogenase subunit alpha